MFLELAHSGVRGDSGRGQAGHEGDGEGQGVEYIRVEGKKIFKIQQQRFYIALL